MAKWVLGKGLVFVRRPGGEQRDPSAGSLGGCEAPGRGRVCRGDGECAHPGLPSHWALTRGIVGSQIRFRETHNGDFVFKTADFPGTLGLTR